MSKVEDDVWRLVEPVINEMKIDIYDVEYLKEGVNRYLRIYIDKENGVCVEDCEAVSRAIEPVIDEAEPINTAYYLEVSSPGIERSLKREGHFTKALGDNIEVSLYKSVDKFKKIKGILKDASKETIKIVDEGKEYIIDKSNIAKAKKLYEF